MGFFKEQYCKTSCLLFFFAMLKAILQSIVKLVNDSVSFSFRPAHWIPYWTTQSSLPESFVP